MAQVYVGIGSNVDRHKHIRSAIDTLQIDFGHLQVSPVYESEAIGFDGDNFYNCVAVFETIKTVGHLSAHLKAIEDQFGRDRSSVKFGARTLDIDVLLYDDVVGEVEGVQLPRDEIVKNAFVLLPLQDIAPQLFHPIEKKTYAELWQEYDKESQALWKVEIDS